MAREKKQPEPEVEAGAPEWMVTFSDCMTLLLTFFVLLISFSSFGQNKKIRELGSVFKSEFSISKQEKDDVESFTLPNPVKPVENINKGSETPTLDNGVAENLKESDNNNDFQNRKVFIIESDKIFLGKGNIISSHGKQVLADLAVFLNEVKGRIVISENGTGDKASNDTGLQRSWAVLECLTHAGLSKDMFSISASGTFSASSVGANRKLEIVLLERSIYN